MLDPARIIMVALLLTTLLEIAMRNVHYCLQYVVSIYTFLVYTRYVITFADPLSRKLPPLLAWLVNYGAVRLVGGYNPRLLNHAGG
uniref:Uncharacterized protein n=1 Tax=Glossina palpalis gambiensis TaxID=67801 RepID=A0A1B0C4A4_9MUSC